LILSTSHAHSEAFDVAFSTHLPLAIDNQYNRYQKITPQKCPFSTSFLLSVIRRLFCAQLESVIRFI